MKSKTLSILAIVSAGPILFAGPLDQPATASKPNFLFIVADDMRWDAM